VLYVGLVTTPGIAVAGLGVHLAGWMLALLELGRLLRLATSGNLAFPRFVVALLAAGWIGAATLFAALAFDAGWAWDIGKRGVWFFLLPLFFSISHRMVPFFSSGVLPGYVLWRPRWVLWLVVAGLFVHGASVAAEYRWLWPDARLPRSCSGPRSVGPRRCFAARLLAVLHLSLVGLAVALALYAVQSATLAATGAAILGTGPLHAMTIGYFSAMAVAMVSRVSLGHSGSALVADTWTWVAFWGLLLTAIARVLAEVARAVPALWPRSPRRGLCSSLRPLGTFRFTRPRADGPGFRPERPFQRGGGFPSLNEDQTTAWVILLDPRTKTRCTASWRAGPASRAQSGGNPSRHMRGARVTAPSRRPCTPRAALDFAAQVRAHARRSEAGTRQALDYAERAAREAGVACAVLRKERENPWEEIIWTAASESCDLIFMASHGRRGVAALVLGSETHKVLTHSKIPVLVCVRTMVYVVKAQHSPRWR
jgi:nucleotide-binding universal stress UspA family protein